MKTMLVPQKRAFKESLLLEKKKKTSKTWKIVLVLRLETCSGMDACGFEWLLN